MRKIPENYPEKIYSAPDKKFYDKKGDRKIAIKQLTYKNKERHMMIAYDEKEADVEIVTIHPISEETIINRVVKGRWIINE
jgi:hypothetical protein